MLILESWEVLWLADRIGLRDKSGTRKVLYLRHVMGFSYAAIGAELKCSAVSANSRASRFWRKVRRHPWKDSEKAYLRAIADESDRIEDRELWDDAYSLWQMFRGVRTGSSPAAVYDELGRVVAARAAMVTVADVYRLLLIRKKREELLRREANQVTEECNAACRSGERTPSAV